ncbi:efflux RND transporter permease subunit [Chitiniphilus purpureus]|uniref:Efflux RND transporter permease subunit n=1 Tax=Chitiniphilus purpureus TaxID=2981137 RepID=A0ABY6DPB5_9NEIS|nr:efflux RND transporter permease subunit [Chitiniphilus sp. CD1]UXY16225.1 efflux RND transporter permease subunit [Chitiniphilus sp. CD1]
MNEHQNHPAAYATHFNLSAWALRHRSLVLYLMIVLSLAGLLSYSRLGQKEDPEFTFKSMVVRAFWPGASASEVERQLTDPLEKSLQGITTIQYMRSYSRAGEALIVISLEEWIRGHQVEGAWYQIRKRVNDLQRSGGLPQGVAGPFFNDEFGETFGNLYAFTGDGFTMPELKRYVEGVRQELLRLKDVNKVELFGEQAQKIYVEYASAKLAALGVSPLQINDVLAATNALSAAGVVEGRDERVFLRVTGNFDAAAQVRDTVLDIGGKRFRLGDVANVYRATIDPPEIGMRYMGRPALGLGVSMKRGGDVLALGEQLDTTLARIKSDLPVGVEFHTVSNQPAVVKNAVGIFMRSLLEAVIIVLAVSFLSLGWRTGIVVALSIPLVLALTFLGMQLAGIDLQRISLGALVIALGLLVDDAIIAVEMMALKLEQGWDRFSAATFAYSSTAMPMLTGTLITAAGFLPVGLAKSNAGEYTFSIFAVVGIALILSWIVAVVFTPYLGYQLLPEKMKQHTHDVYQGRFYRRFRSLVTWCITWRKTTIGVTVLAFVLSMVLFSTAVQKQFFPASSRPELMVDLWLPYAASYEATEREAKKLEAILMRDPDVQSVTSYIGTGSPRFYLPLDQQQPNLNYAQLMVMTKSEKVRDNVYRRVAKLFTNDFPQVRGRVTRLENGPPVGYPLQFRVLGKDPAVLRQVGEQVAAVMRSNPHAREVHFDWGEKVKVLRIHADQDKLRAVGLTTQQLAQYLQLAVSGVTATQYREHNEMIDVVARLVPGERASLAAVRNLPVKLANGATVPLSQLGEVRLEAEESLIWRRNRVPTLSVRADVAGAQPPDVATALQPEIDALAAKLPAGYHIEVGGTLEASKVGQRSISAVMPLMLLVVTTLLMIQLNSIRLTVMVLLTAPLGLIGVTMTLLLFNAPFGFVAQLGVIALSGMIIRNSVILMDQIKQDISHGHDPWTAVIESAVRRFRPIMLTAAAAILAMIPLTRDTFWGPMAIAIMGGLFVATLLTLLFLPALYVAWNRVAPTPAPAQGTH